MIVTEAAACGTPAVVTRVAGHVDAVVEGRTGLLADTGARSSALALDAVLSDADLRDRLGAGALEHAARFTWEATARGTLEVLARSRDPASRHTSDRRRSPARPTRAEPERSRAASRPAACGCARVRGARRARVRPDAAHRAGQGRRRHQELPLPRPGPAARAGAVDVGPEHRARHRHPPEHRLPVPDGPVLLGHALRRRAGWVSQRLWLGSILLFAGARRCSTCSARCTCAARACVVGDARVHAEPVHARLRGAHLGDPAAVGRAAVDARARDPRRCATTGWRYPALFAIVVQVVGSVNATALVFAGIAPVLWISYAVLVTREVDAGAASSRPLRRSGCSRCSRRCGGSSGLWVQSGYGLDILKFTETLETVSQRVAAERGAPRPRVLVLLRPRQDRPLDRAERPLHAGHLAASSVSYAHPDARAARAALVRWRHRGVLRGRHARRRRGRGRRASRTTTRRSSARLFKAFAESSNFGLALRSTGRAVPLVVLGLAVLLGAGVNAVARRARRRAACPVAGPRGRGRRDRARDREPARAVERHVLRREPAARRGHPAVLDGRDRRPRRRSARHAGARDPGRRLRVVPLGQHRRPDHARAHGPPLRRPRAGPVGLAGVGRPAQRARPAAPGRRARPVGDRADRPADERRRRRVPRRPRRPTASTSCARCPSGQLLTNPSVPTGLGAPTAFGTSLGPPLHYPLSTRSRSALPAERARPAAGQRVPGEDAPSIVRSRGRGRAARGRRATARARRSRRPRARSTPATSCSTPARSRATPRALRSADRATRLGARRHRLQPQARPPLGHDPRRRGRDRTRRRDRADHRRERRPPRRVPRRGHRRVHRRAVSERRGEHHALRQPHHLLARRPRGACVRRRRQHRVAGGRRTRRSSGEQIRVDLDQPDHHRPREPRAAAQSAERALPHQGAAHVRRRRPRSPSTSATRRAPPPGRPSRSRRGRSTGSRSRSPTRTSATTSTTR